MLISFLFFDFLIFDVLGVKTFDVRATIMVRALEHFFSLLLIKKCIWEMGLLSKNTYKTSFFFVKRQKYNQKVVLFIVFV